jgi:hypothetical protein
LVRRRIVSGGLLVVLWVEEVVALRVAERGFDLLLADSEGVQDVFQEDQAENGVLVNGGVHAGAQPVRSTLALLVEVAEELLSG